MINTIIELCVIDSWKTHGSWEYLSDHVAQCVREWIGSGSDKCGSYASLYRSRLQI